MQVLLRTADNIEAIVSVPAFTLTITRPVLRRLRLQVSDDVEATTVSHIRRYEYLGTRLKDDLPIYREVLE